MSSTLHKTAAARPAHGSSGPGTELQRGGFELRPLRFLFRSRLASMIWLVARLWLGWQWFSAGWGKLTGAAYNNWFTHSVGLQGFIASANGSYEHRAQTFGHPEVNYGWYLHVLNAMDGHAQLFSRIVTVSELAVGVGLLLGCLTGLAAAGGVALNLLYITGGSAGPNGIFIVLGVLLIAAWRISGYWGVDYFALPRLAALWRGGGARSGMQRGYSDDRAVSGPAADTLSAFPGRT